MFTSTNVKGVKKCAFCISWYDPTNSYMLCIARDNPRRLAPRQLLLVLHLNPFAPKGAVT